MKKNILIGVGLAVIIVLGLLGWYFLSPSASKPSLSKELTDISVSTVSIESESYKSGSCFDTCASMTRVAKIPSTADFTGLYSNAKQKLEQNDYTVSTTEEEFLSPTYPNGNPSGSYLTLDAKGKNGYQLKITYQNSASKQPSLSNRNGETVTSVNQAVYSVSANTR